MRILDKPISFSDDRRSLMLDYTEQHYGFRPDDLEIVPRIIVLHWTAIDDFNKSFSVFNRERLGSSRPDLQQAGQANVSIHFLIDRDGRIFRLMPETRMARHCIGLNYDSIGVENVGGAGGEDNLTDAQIRANIRLVRYLARKHPTLSYLIGHHEYRLFEGHPLWRETDPGYRTQKSDPGDRFMNAVRRGVRAARLKGPEAIRAELEQEPDRP